MFDPLQMLTASNAGFWEGDGRHALPVAWDGKGMKGLADGWMDVDCGGKFPRHS